MLARVATVLMTAVVVCMCSEENRRKEAMRSRQIAERLGVEEAHMLEFQQFTALYVRLFLFSPFSAALSLCLPGMPVGGPVPSLLVSTADRTDRV